MHSPLVCSWACLFTVHRPSWSSRFRIGSHASQSRLHLLPPVSKRGHVTIWRQMTPLSSRQPKDYYESRSRFPFTEYSQWSNQARNVPLPPHQWCARKGKCEPSESVAFVNQVPVNAWNGQDKRNEQSRSAKKKKNIHKRAKKGSTNFNI